MQGFLSWISTVSTFRIGRRADRVTGGPEGCPAAAGGAGRGVVGGDVPADRAHPPPWRGPTNEARTPGRGKRTTPAGTGGRRAAGPAGGSRGSAGGPGRVAGTLPASAG